MVISDKFKYVFIQTPMTGSSAVAEELKRNYHGQEILSKHALYSSFQAISRKEQQDYFVFSCVRNPLDKYVSNYVKLLNNHNERFTQPLNKDFRKAVFQLRDRRKYKKVQKGCSFQEFLFSSKIYDETSALYYNELDYVMHFETLPNDFKKVLDILKIGMIRELPKYNATKNKKHFLEYYNTPIIREAAISRFGVFMTHSDYDFPEDWQARKPTLTERIEFQVWRVIRIITWKYVRKGIRGHRL